MPAIFISYRREDAEGEAGRLFDDLVPHFAAGSVFMDVTVIQMGRDFRKAIDDGVATCDVFLAVIGKSWSDGGYQGAKEKLFFGIVNAFQWASHIF